MAGRRVIVVGAGIAGLSAAHRLATDHPDVDLTVLEAADAAGGHIRTSPFAGLPVDEAADAFLVRVPWALDLCRELDLAEELVTPSARTASVWLDGALRPLPSPNVLGIPLDPTATRPSGRSSEPAWATPSSNGSSTPCWAASTPDGPTT